MKEEKIFEGKDKKSILKEASKYFGVEEHNINMEIIDESRKIFSRYYKIKCSITSKTDLENKLNEANNNLTINNNKNDIQEFELKYTEEGIYLTVNNNKKNIYQKIIKLLDKKEVNDYDKSKIEDCINNVKSSKIVAPYQKEKVIDESIEISLSKDKMKAFIEYIPGDKNSEKLKFDQALNFIKKEIRSEIDKKTLKEMLFDKIYNQKILISEGMKAIDGEDGYVEYKVDISKDIKPKELENGKVDFRNLNLINNVKKDDILAIINEPTLGKNGYNVLGEKIEAKPGKKSNYRLGKNVDVIDNTVISTIDGQINIDGNKIGVSNSYRVKGNVDNSTGNIKFNGSVFVEKGLKTGFKIEAEGDVEISGVVEDASIISGGNIFVSRGVVGKKSAFIKANGQITSRYIENAKICAEGEITSEAILHSKVISNDVITVKGNKGLIVGGECKAKHEINAKVIGSPMETDTIIEVGTDPNLKEKLEKSKKELIDLETELSKIKKSIDILDKKLKINSLSDKQKNLFKKLLSTYNAYSDNHNNIKEVIKNTENEIKVLTNGIINVKGIIYPGVKIVIGNNTMFIREPMKNCNIKLSNGKIKVFKSS